MYLVLIKLQVFMFLQHLCCFILLEAPGVAKALVVMLFGSTFNHLFFNFFFNSKC